MNKLQEQRVRKLIREQINEIQRVSVIRDLIIWVTQTLEKILQTTLMATPLGVMGGASQFTDKDLPSFKQLAKYLVGILGRGLSSIAATGSVGVIRKLKEFGIAPEAAQELLDTELPAGVLKFITYNLAAGAHNFNPGVKAPKELRNRIKSGQIKTMQQVIDFVQDNQDEFFDKDDIPRGTNSNTSNIRTKFLGL